MAATAENEAYLRAVRWVRLDDHYVDKHISARDEALMRLAIRCLWSGHLVDEAIARLEADAPRRGCACGMADYGSPGHEGHGEWQQP